MTRTYSLTEQQFIAIKGALNAAKSACADGDRALNGAVIFDDESEPAPTIPAPPPEVTPIPPVAASEFGAPDANGVQSWTFLASLANEWCPVPAGIIANFAAWKFALDTTTARAIEMNAGANAGLFHNIAHTIVESTGLWDRLHGRVTHRQHDVIPGVIAFQDEIGMTGRSTHVDAEVAKAMLRGRVKRMAMSANLRNWTWLDKYDYQAGLAP